VIWLEIKVAAFAGLGWIALAHPALMLASVPVLALGMRIIWGVFTLPPGPGFNRLLALGGAQLILFAAVFHFAAARIA
jgi:1,4-dihydroxy-2-naphthoate polyprenyltransferase